MSCYKFTVIIFVLFLIPASFYLSSVTQDGRPGVRRLVLQLALPLITGHILCSDGALVLLVCQMGGLNWKIV